MVSEKRKEYLKKYMETHREQIRESQKKYKLAHPERVREQKYKWFNKNKEKVMEYNKKKKKKNREKMLQYGRDYAQEHKEQAKKNIETFKKKNDWSKYCAERRRERVERLRAEGVTNAWAVCTTGAEPKYKKDSTN